VTLISPLASHSLDRLAHACLVKAAHELRFNDKYDIACRLEAEPWYSKPLVDHVSHRLVLARSAVKHNLDPVVMAHFRLKKGDVTRASQLLDRSCYIYPMTDEIPDRTKPFSGEIVPETVKVAFFGSGGTGVKYSNCFKSSLCNKPDEYEVPPTMVALTMTATEALLRDAQGGLSSDFVGEIFDAIFNAHLLRLVNLRVTKPLIYHRLMHKMFLTVTSLLSERFRFPRQEILDGTDWDNMTLSD